VSDNFSKSLSIIGSKLILRPIEFGDTENIVRWRNNPKVRENFIFKEKFTPEMHLNWMNTKVKNGEVVQFIITEKCTSNSIGSVYFRDINNEFHSAEFGIFIGVNEAQGKGYGTEATKLFSDYGFKALKLHRISLRVFERNVAAIKCYETAGFKREGLFKDMVCFDGIYENILFMAKIK